MNAYQIYKTGEPFDMLQVGDVCFTPWLERLPKRKNAHKLDQFTWRTPAGARWTFNKIEKYAKRTGKIVRRIYFVPNLVDPEAIKRENRLFNS